MPAIFLGLLSVESSVIKIGAFHTNLNDGNIITPDSRIIRLTHICRMDFPIIII